MLKEEAEHFEALENQKILSMLEQDLQPKAFNQDFIVLQEKEHISSVTEFL